MNELVNLAEKFAQVDKPWSPRVVGELNGQFVKIAKFDGEFIWHQHEEEDELFWVVEGEIELHFRDRVVTLRPGELFVVPRGVEHKPVSKGGANVVMFEPASTRNTGNVESDLTVEAADLERV